MEIYLIRHARQNSPLCNVDVPLANEGYEQIKLLGERIQSWGIGAIYCSDLLRAKQTAQELQKWIPVSIYERKELEEIDYGELTGNSDEENREKYKFFFEKKAQMRWDLEYPGGENNEAVFQRGMPVLEEITKSGLEKVVVVTHGGLIRSLVCGILDIPFSRVYQLSKVMENTSITTLCYDEKSKAFSLQVLNDYAHLEKYPKLLRQTVWKK